MTILAGGLLYLFKSLNTPAQPEDYKPLSQITAGTPTIPDSAHPSLGAGGSSLKDSKNVFTVLYPSDYATDTENNGQYSRIYKRGKTQTGQTEMFDGVLMVFETVELNGKTLSGWVDDYIKTTTADGTLVITQPKTAMLINSYPAFTYETRGLGESKNYILQKDNKSGNAVIVTTSVQDPEHVGYQKEVDSILSSMTLLK